MVRMLYTAATAFYDAFSTTITGKMLALRIKESQKFAGTIVYCIVFYVDYVSKDFPKVEYEVHKTHTR